MEHQGHAASRPCAEEEDVARELLASLNADQRGVVVICAVAPPDFVLTNLPAVPESAQAGEGAPAILRGFFDAVPAEQLEPVRFERMAPRGLPAAAMDTGQQRLLSELVNVYVERLPEPMAALERARIDAAGFDTLHFAWAGEVERRRGHYYRVQGRELLIEYDNTQNDANHAHAVWRHPRNDFGADVLRAHLRAAH